MQTGIVNFKDDKIWSFKDEDGNVFVAMKSVVNNIGLKWWTQWNKIKSHSNYTHKSIVHTAADGKQREMLCLPLDQFPAWLYSVNPNRVKESIKDKLIEYQQETFDAINDYWNKGIAINETKVKQSKYDPELMQSIKNDIQTLKQTLVKEEKSEPQSLMSRLDERFSFVKEVVDFFGEPSAAVMTNLRDSLLSEMNGEIPDTLHDQDWYYARDVWMEYKKEGYVNTGYKDEKTLLQALGRRASSVADEREKAPQMIDGRIVDVHLYHKIDVERAIFDMVGNGLISKVQQELFEDDEKVVKIS